MGVVLSIDIGGLVFPIPPKLTWEEDKNFAFYKIHHRGASNLEQPNLISVAQCPAKLTYSRTMIYSHGNACDLPRLKKQILHLSQLLEANIVSYDYPGYGESTGLPTEDTCTVTLDYVVRHIKTLVSDPKSIYLMGHSMGTGVTVNYAFCTKWTNPIILVAPYKSVPRVVFDYYRIDTVPIFQKYKFESFKKMHDLLCPVKIIHGEQDKVIPISHAQYLYRRIPKDKRKWKPTFLKDAHHNNIVYVIEKNIWSEVFQ